MKRMEKSFTYGMITALLLVALLASSNALEYLYDNVEMGSNAVSGVATPTALSDGATKGYVDTAATLSCTWESLKTTACNSGRCYANKPTADKVCIDKGYQYASTYTFITTSLTYTTYTWRGASWNSQSIAEDTGYGGGITGSSLSGSAYLSYALCCE